MADIGAVRPNRDHGLRVMTWNVRGAARPDLRSVADVVAAEAPDVLALQEVRRGQVARIAERLGLDHRWDVKHRPFGRLGGRWAEGLAVASRFPIGASLATELSGEVPMRSFRRRVLQEVLVTTPAGPVRVANAHLSSDDESDRGAQTARAVAALTGPIGAVGIGRTVVLGDLNTVDADEVLGGFARAGLRDGWTDLGLDLGGGATNPAHAPVQRLDHVLIGAEFAVASVRVVVGAAAGLSDHLPVVADLVVSEGPAGEDVPPRQ